VLALLLLAGTRPGPTGTVAVELLDEAFQASLGDQGLEARVRDHAASNSEYFRPPATTRAGATRASPRLWPARAVTRGAGDALSAASSVRSPATPSRPADALLQQAAELARDLPLNRPW
jgi:hypothetical protein